jgi:hypothetical protein
MAKNLHRLARKSKVLARRPIGSFIDRQDLPSVGLGRFAARTWENLVEAFQDFTVQRNFRGAQGGLQLLDGSGTDDRRSHDGVVQKPSQGHGGGRCAQLFTQCLVLFQLGPVFIDFLQGFLAGAPAAFQLFQGSGQKAAAKGTPGDQSQAVISAGGDNLQFEHAVVEVVDALFAGQTSQTASGSFLAGGGNVPCREVAGPHVNHLALVPQLLEGLPSLVPGAFPVHVVHLVKIDVVGLESFEAAFAVFADLVRRKAAAVCVGFCQVGLALDGIEHFGGQDHRVPAAATLGKPASQDLLSVALLAAPAVDVGSVKKVDTELQSPVHNLETLFLGGVPAEVHRAQAYVAYQNSVFSQMFVFDCHVSVPLLFFADDDPCAPANLTFKVPGCLRFKCSSSEIKGRTGFQSTNLVQ